jgi:microcin C transport system substrate-binding protein
MVTYAWDPSAGDPSVPAELGGPGFTGEGWTTNMVMHALGDPRAVPGGTMVLSMPDWPPTLRQTGKDWNTEFTYRARDLCWESLIGVSTVTLEYVPGLATHWWIADDKMTYRFRINPKARWNDGSEVTAADVVASFKLRMDPTLLDPANILVFGKLEEPVALSKYVVEVKVKEENWRNFLYFGGMSIFPAKDCSMSGTDFLSKWQFKAIGSSGPYFVDTDGMVMGQTISLKRRSDWWDQDNPAGAGTYNIGEYKFVVVKDPNLEYEKVKKGEIDYFTVPKAQWWAEEIPKLEPVRRGLLVPRKFYTDAPKGTSGMAINTTRPPLDDRNVRMALQLLLDRPTMIRQLYFDEYLPLTSYFAGGVYANPDNEPYPYDEFRAVELLEESGWTQKNPQGYRVKDGRELELEVMYRTPLSERSLTVFQEACKRAGIRIELQLLTPAAAWKNLRERKYDLADTNWGALTFPNPETSFHSSLATQVDNNNVTAFADPRVDELCQQYDKEYDAARRIAIVREIDGIVYRAVPYVLEWYLPAERILFWNKFGMPEWASTRTADYSQLHYLWWVDPEKEKQLAAARQDPTRTMDPGERNNTFWQEWEKLHGRAAPQ